MDEKQNNDQTQRVSVVRGKTTHAAQSVAFSANFFHRPGAPLSMITKRTMCRRGREGSGRDGH